MAAIIFDCDGVLADTERYGHLVAFNQMFGEFDLPVSWSDEDYAQLVLIGGGKERLASLLTPEFIAEAGLPSDPTAQRERVAEWHRRKTEIYTALIESGAIPPRAGIARIADEALARNITLAVASTSAEPSVRAVLTRAVGPERAADFHVFAGDIVAAKKPAPDIYLLVLDALALSPEDAIVIEDSSNGLRAALGAGLTTVVTESSYTHDEDFTGAALVVDSLGDPNGESTTVQDAAAGITPQGCVTVDDLLAILHTSTRKATNG
jgi:HAD superfamily hydrolase (TIGR01509 family)